MVLDLWALLYLLLAQFGLHKACTCPLPMGSLLLSDMLEKESGLSGGEESTSTGSSSFTLTSEGVCKLMSSAPELGAGNYMGKRKRDEECDRRREG